MDFLHKSNPIRMNWINAFHFNGMDIEIYGKLIKDNQGTI